MPSTIRLATWNINSIRLRIGAVKQFAEDENPDIICVQETKTPDAQFPLDAIHQMGYVHTAFSGQKGYNGVAILSRIPLINVCAEAFMQGMEHTDRRHMVATLPDGTQIHNFYVPAGGDVPDIETNDKFVFKLKFVDAMRDYFTDKRFNGSKTIMVGDFNIAPGEHDVWSHKQLLKIISHTPVEVEKLQAVYDTQNWIDTARIDASAEEKIYSWWSYRNRDWEKSNRGRRLDHIWLTPALKDAFAGVRHLSHMRSWEKPSDHVPVITDLKLGG
ncbi:MAG: exodeoxyribonuclease III [Alphaproteobacteria bacterium]|nr:exodeoxyribonuclease III [Alphaproteobacteria bacterium]